MIYLWQMIDDLYDSDIWYMVMIYNVYMVMIYDVYLWLRSTMYIDDLWYLIVITVYIIDDWRWYRWCKPFFPHDL